MNDTEHTRIDRLLDLLTDEVAARLQARNTPQPLHDQRIEPAPPPQPQANVPAASAEPVQAVTAESPSITAEGPAPSEPPVVTPEPDIATARNTHIATFMARLALGILIAVVLINIPLPFNTQSTALARSIPNSASLVIANGLLVKEQSSPDVYVYRDDAFHWVTSIEVFQQMGFRWENVHEVEPGFLSQFAKGRPYYMLMKCDGSPHVYRFEAGTKRWIIDIPTFEAEGYVWEDVKFVSCAYLHNLPDGDSIPPGHGTPKTELP